MTEPMTDPRTPTTEPGRLTAHEHYELGRADALREAADAVRALAAPKYDGDTWTKDCEHGWDTHGAAVLAILQPDAET